MIIRLARPSSCWMLHRRVVSGEPYPERARRAILGCP